MERLHLARSRPCRRLMTLHTHYAKLAEMAKRDMDLLKSHSIDEAEAGHEKLRSRR